MVGGDFRPQGEAPSLEEVLEKFMQQWRGFSKRTIAIVIAVVAALIVIWTFWFTVQPEETGVVQRFGKVVRTAGPGLHFKLPVGIETIRTVPTARVLKEEFGFRTLTAAAPGQRTQYADNKAYKVESLMLTGDLNVIDVQWIMQYRIEDPVRFLFYVRETPKTIRDITESVMRRVVGNRLGSDVLTVGRVEVSSEAKVEIQKILTDYETGVRLVTVELQDVTPPDAVKPAFNEVNEAQQEREKMINQARSEYNKVIPKAKGDAARVIEEAKGYAIERVNQARGESTKFNAVYKEFSKAPEVTQQRIYLETMNEVLPKVGRKLVTDKEMTGILPLFQLEKEGKKNE